MFFIGTVLGLAVAAGALHGYNVDQVREVSIVEVVPDGGNREAFHISIPMDRIMVGAPGQENALPPGLDWPIDDVLANVRAEMFKIRNANDRVIGVAVRAAAEEGDKDIIDWMLHLPARGSILVNMDAVPREGGYRIGEIRAGSREFASLQGFMTERWVANDSDDEDAPIGFIQLTASYLSTDRPVDDREAVE